MGRMRVDEFPLWPANDKSIAHRKPLYDVGINDAWYIVNPLSNIGRLSCPVYSVWRSMIVRCYSVKHQERQPEYIGCTVCPEWLTFSVFRSWMITQESDGLELDKDIRHPGNKIYSPGTCMFIPQEINKLLTSCAAARGEYPCGVHLHKASGKFQATCTVDSKAKYLGSFDTPEEASDTYREFKAAHVRQVAQEQDEPLRGHLMAHADIIGL